MKFKPIGDKVLIRKDKLDSSNQYETNSGIVVVNSEDTRHKGRFSLGEVLAIGESFIDSYQQLVKIKDILKVGDKVLYYHPAEIKLSDDLILVRAIDIDAIVVINDGEQIKLRS